MTLIRRAGLRVVNKHGAVAGCVLLGVGLNNQGLRRRVLQGQARGDGGPIKGNFVILDVGDNKHSESLAGLLQTVTNAKEVLGVIRQLYAGCVNVANANILALESTGATRGVCDDR